MSESVLKAVKLFVVVAGLLIVGGTATLIWLLVKRSGVSAQDYHPAVTMADPGTVALPAGGEITQVATAGGQLLLLGRSPAEGQFLLFVDLASGERRLLRLVPARP